jgi:hypothetical protein
MDDNPQNSGLIAMVPRYAVGMPGGIFSPMGRNGANSALAAAYAPSNDAVLAASTTSIQASDPAIGNAISPALPNETSQERNPE